MPNQTEQVQALQYLFDVARTAPAPAAVHAQAKTYAQYLAASFNPPPAEVEKPKLETVAEAVAKAKTAPDEKVVDATSVAPDEKGRPRAGHAANFAG